MARPWRAGGPTIDTESTALDSETGSIRLADGGQHPCLDKELYDLNPPESDAEGPTLEALQ